MRDWSKSIMWFRRICRYRNNRALIYFTFLTRGLKFKPLSMWIKMIYELSLHRKLLFIRVNARMIWQAFWHTEPTCANTSGNFFAFPTGSKFLFLAQQFATFGFGFSVWFFKKNWIQPFYQISWKADLQSLNRNWFVLLWRVQQNSSFISVKPLINYTHLKWLVVIKIMISA